MIVTFLIEIKSQKMTEQQENFEEFGSTLPIGNLYRRQNSFTNSL